MKSLLKNLYNSNISVLLRNSINFRPIYYSNIKKNYPTSVSDAFLWRTDNGYKTLFKFSDILNLFYKIDNSYVEILFFSKEHKLIKIKKINDLNLSNEFEITSKYLNDITDYGTFYIYHYSSNTKNLSNKDSISNRCYTGYSKNNNLYSFVHGNINTKYSSIWPLIQNTPYQDSIMSEAKNYLNTSNLTNLSLFKNQIYTIQKNFQNFDKNELFFTNPTKFKIYFSIGNKNFKLKPYNSILIEVKDPIISIKSNCMFLRPTIFSYKEKYFDVHHS